LLDWQSVLECTRLDRARGQLAAAASRPIGLRVNRCDVVTRGDECIERRNRE
jgi:hypothetical protein